MFSPDLPIFSALGYGVFESIDDYTLQLKNPPVDWLPQYFGDRWDPETRILKLEEFSLIATFLSHCLECDEKGELLDADKITFEESYVDGRHFIGQVTSYQVDNTMLFIIRKADDLDSVSRDELQTLRRSALGCSNFSRAKDHKNNHAILNNAGDFGDGVALASAAISGSPHPVIVLDGEHQLVMANSLAHQQFPKLSSNTEDPFDSLLKATVSHQEAKTLFSKLEQGLQDSVSSLWSVPLPYPRKVKVEVRPVFKQNGNFGGSVWTFLPEASHSTESLDAVVSESERLEVIGRLAGGVAHDFNNLLAIVLGNLSILMGDNRIKNDITLKDPVSMANQAANNAARLVRQLLGYSRKTRLDKAAINTRSLISEATSLFTSNTPDTFSIISDLDDDTWEIDADESQILQVLINIFDNALAATEATGDVHITARNFVLNDQDLCDAFECDPGHYVILTIADRGIGMSREVGEKVFEPFFTTKGPGGNGTGLGMANALGIIRQHGGHISFTSALGQGTTFNLYLPRFRVVDKVERSPRVNGREANHAGDKAPGVLVVDDEELLRNLVRTLCEKNGYRTFGAADGQEALEFMRENPDEVFAAVLDLAMPRMTGTELFRQMNQLGIDLPVIIASGFLVDSDKFIEETGGTPCAIFSKPYQLNDLIGKINELRDEAGVVLSS